MLQDKAKALVGGLLLALVAYGASWAKAKFGVVVPEQTLSWVAEAGVALLFGAIGGWAIWKTPNAPSA